MPNQKPLILTHEQKHKLVQTFERFKDDIELDYPSVPVFYGYPISRKKQLKKYDAIFSDYSKKSWDLFSLSSLQRNYEANEAIRKELKAISASGVSGIAYVLNHPAMNQTSSDALLDKILMLWQRRLPSSINDYALMVEYHVLSEFDDWFYGVIHDFLRKIDPDYNKTADELLILCRKISTKKKLIRYLVAKLEPGTFAESLFENESLFDSISELVDLYVQDFHLFDFDEDALLARNEDEEDTDQGLLRKAFNTRMLEQEERHTNLTGQLQLQTPLIEQDKKLHRLNGPVLPKHCLKSFKLDAFQASCDSHIMIDLQKVELGQDFFDLMLAVCLSLKIIPLSSQLLTYIAAREEGLLEVPVCLLENSPLQPLFEQVECIKDANGKDKVFDEFGIKFKRVIPQPDYKAQIKQRLDDFLVGHEPRDLTPRQRQCLINLGIRPTQAIAFQKVSTITRSAKRQSNCLAYELSSMFSSGRKEKKQKLEHQEEVAQEQVSAFL